MKLLLSEKKKSEDRIIRMQNIKNKTYNKRNNNINNNKKDNDITI